MGPSTLTRNVDRLVSGGWVERRPGSTNRREVLIAATEQGRALVDESASGAVGNSPRSSTGYPNRTDRGDRRHAGAPQAMDEPLPEEVSAFGG